MSKTGAGGPFKKGHEKFAGRKIGTPNKKTMELFEILSARDFNPAEKILDLFESTEDDHLKATLLGILMRYVYPQRKTVDVSGQVDHKLVNRIQELKAMSPEDLEQARIRALKLVGSKGEQR